MSNFLSILCHNNVDNWQAKLGIPVQNHVQSFAQNVNNFIIQIIAVVNSCHLHKFSIRITQPFQQSFWQTTRWLAQQSTVSTGPTITTTKLKTKERNNNGFRSYTS